MSSRSHRRLTWTAVALVCVVAVLGFGELSTGALVVLSGVGLAVTGAGLTRRAGAAAVPVGRRRGLPWLGWLAAGLAWEVVTLAVDDVPTVSDLADPVLAQPPVRAAATVGWVAAGAWLLARPGPRRP